MDMNARFADLRKIPKEPAARLLARASTKLRAPVRAPASAPVAVVLDELARSQAWIDMLRLLSVALPPRERVWWACLAGRDLVEAGEGGKVPAPLAAAEAWVFKPTEANRAAAQAAIDAADIDDDTALCCTAVIFGEDPAAGGAPKDATSSPGAAPAAAFCMNLKALGLEKTDFARAANQLIDRALDIARGGNGRIDKSGSAEPKA
jgi:hypothetical protein